MSTVRENALVSLVAAGRPSQYEAGQCAAWLEAAGRVCKRPAGGKLCKRHHTVAERRFEVAKAKRQAEETKWAAKREAAQPRREARLAAVEKRLDAIDPFRRDGETADRAAANAPLGQRLPSDARISELAQLHRERGDLRRALGLRGA